MNVRNCKKCGRMFNYIVGLPVCSVCKEALEAKFVEVKEYIREHKGVNMTEVAEACDVDKQQITQWLREERLEITEDSALTLNCETCGTTIRSGRYCDKCRANLTNTLRGAAKDLASRSSQPGSPAPMKNGSRMRSWE